MLVIVSTKSLHDKINLELLHAIPYDHWIIVRSMPVSKNQIQNLLEKHNCRSLNGKLLFLTNAKRKKPSEFPGLFIDNWLLSFVFYENIKDIHVWIKALRNGVYDQNGKVCVLGMMKPYYMKWANKIYNTFHNSGKLNGRTTKCLADTTTNVELAQKLSKGCSMAVYVGHGRSRGWSGYRGFRWKHMEETIQKKPVGILFHFSCNGLMRNRALLPFGLQWVTSGRACSSIAACESLQLEPLEEIAKAFMESVTSPELTRLDEILFSMNNIIKRLDNPLVEKTWQLFRLIGNPLQKI